MFGNLALDDFWEESKFAREKYVEKPVVAELLAVIEEELGFKLPLSYVGLMQSQNGGIPKRTCFPVDEKIRMDRYFTITGFFGIGRTKDYSLLGKLGSKFMQAEWGYPTFGICICNCPSGGHEMIMLDYRECGPHGEPTVVHVDQESNFKVTRLAHNFEVFVQGLVRQSDFETEPATLDFMAGLLSTALSKVLKNAPKPAETERALRNLLRTIATEKGYFALHGDKLSYLTYDLLFDIYANTHAVPTVEVFLTAYEELLAFGDGEISTGGYAPGFLAGWIKKRLAKGAIIEHEGTLRHSTKHRERLVKQLTRFQ